MSDSMAFPLTLTLTQLEVTRADEGVPSVFLTLYSPTGGVSTDSWSDTLLGWIWLPLVATLFFLARFCEAYSRPDLHQN